MPIMTNVQQLAVRTAVPMSGPDISDRDIEAVVAVLTGGCLSLGPNLQRFEQEVARLTGADYGIALSSGTAGLHLAMIAAAVQPNDFVITTPFSFVASANCVLYERAIPIFVDVDPQTGNIDPELVAQAAHDLRAGGTAGRRWLPPSLRDSSASLGRLKAIVPVHAFGQPADMDPILDVSRDLSVPVIEDACEAIGSTYKGRPAGALGDAGVLAFYPNKQITTAEGGMLLTSRRDWAERVRSLRNQGRDNMDAWLHHDRLGYNYRMSELSAALGVSQVSRIWSLLDARERVAGWYASRLADVPGVHLPVLSPNTTFMSWFAYVVRFDEDVNRRAVMEQLQERLIPSRAYFAPIHLQPFYMREFGYRAGSFPIAEALGRSSLALPFSSTLREHQVAQVCEALTEVMAAHATSR